MRFGKQTVHAELGRTTLSLMNVIIGRSPIVAFGFGLGNKEVGLLRQFIQLLHHGKCQHLDLFFIQFPREILPYKPDRIAVSQHDRLFKLTSEQPKGNVTKVVLGIEHGHRCAEQKDGIVLDMLFIECVPQLPKCDAFNVAVPGQLRSVGTEQLLVPELIRELVVFMFFDPVIQRL